MSCKILIPAMIALMGVSSGAWAADDDDGAEATIRLMGTAEAELPGAVTKTITLPEHLLVEGDDQVAAVEKAKKDHDKANQRLEKREKGLAQAEAAREHGKEMSEKAKEARENRGRSEDRPERPDPPGRPESPPGRP